MIIDTIIIIGLSVLIAALGTMLVVQQIKIRGMEKSLKQSEIDIDFLADEVLKISDELDKARLEASDGFVKFLSDSREWAFGFIEKVQDDLKSLFDSIAAGESDPQKLMNLKQYLPTEEPGEQQKG